MANAYATIASVGIRHKPIAVKKVVFPDGKSEDLGKPKGKRKFSQGVAWEATKILEQNIQRGTGTGANIGCPAAGKTGTVDDWTDAWFIGFTPKLTTAAWVGYPNQKVPMLSVHGIRVAGGTIPASIWHDYMGSVATKDCSDFQAPAGGASFQPFYGKYSSNGYSGGGGGYDSGSQQQDQSRNDSQDTGPGNNGGGGYDPNLYESPPQAAPKTQAPSTGGGGGGGGGKDHGNGGGNGGGKSGGTSPG
jgi:penicillin-binding protein 1A